MVNSRAHLSISTAQEANLAENGNLVALEMLPKLGEPSEEAASGKSQDTSSFPAIPQVALTR